MKRLLDAARENPEIACGIIGMLCLMLAILLSDNPIPGKLFLIGLLFGFVGFFIWVKDV